MRGVPGASARCNRDRPRGQGLICDNMGELAQTAIVGQWH
jgi:hypothetical protein